MSKGLILFAHGAREAAWAAPFEAVAARLRAQRPGVRVALAYLELMTPDLSGAAAALVQAGCTRVDIVPMFLGTGGHVRRDLPALVQTLRGLHRSIVVRHHLLVSEAAIRGSHGEAVPDALDELSLIVLSKTQRPLEPRRHAAGRRVAVERRQHLRCRNPRWPILGRRRSAGHGKHGRTDQQRGTISPPAIIVHHTPHPAFVTASLIEIFYQFSSDRPATPTVRFHSERQRPAVLRFRVSGRRNALRRRY